MNRAWWRNLTPSERERFVPELIPIHDAVREECESEASELSEEARIEGYHQGALEGEKDGYAEGYVAALQNAETRLRDRLTHDIIPRFNRALEDFEGTRLARDHFEAQIAKLEQLPRVIHEKNHDA